MGNCFPKPINNLPSATKLSSSPVTLAGGGGGGHVKKQQNVSTGSGNREKGPVISEKKHGDRGGTEVAAAAAGGEVDGGVLDTVPASGRIVTPDLKMFTFAELWSATRKFRPDTMLGEGGFGRVFKGWVDPKTYAPSRVGVGIPVAVKKSSPDSPQGLKEWQAEVKFLGKFSHPNLVRLLGYCWEDREFLLVYEYMQKGSLENHLFKKGAETLTWDTRIKIAIGAAQGLAFLHNTEKTVIYRDFKAANILLDGEYNAKLSDFGLAKLGPANGESHVSTGVVGTYGYAAPEYMATGHLYVKSDVYGFGVVLLEIITGMRVLDTNRPSTQHNLVDWAKPSLADKRKLRKIIDPRLEQDFPSKGAIKAAELILTCLEPDPKNRPSMDQVLESLEVIRAIETKPREPRHGNGYEAGQYHQHRPANHRQHSYHPSPVNSRQGGGARADRLSPHRSY